MAFPQVVILRLVRFISLMLRVYAKRSSSLSVLVKQSTLVSQMMMNLALLQSPLMMVPFNVTDDLTLKEVHQWLIKHHRLTVGYARSRSGAVWRLNTEPKLFG
jgi:hypothetical protein